MRNWKRSFWITCFIIFFVFFQQSFLSNQLLQPLYWMNVHIPSIKQLLNDNAEETIPVSASNEIPFPPIVRTKPIGKGVILTFDAPVSIIAEQEGLLLFTGQTRKTGTTMTVMYESNEAVTYGFLSELTKLPYTSVYQNELLGQTEGNDLYVEIEKDGKFESIDEIVERFSP